MKDIDLTTAELNEQADTRHRLVYIPVGKLFPHPDNPRKDLGDLSELTDSIIANGVMQNLTVVPSIKSTPEYEAMVDGKTKCSEAFRSHSINHAFSEDYTLIIGHRRYAAAVAAGVTGLPCVVAQMDYPTQIATMMTENLQRADLTVFEQAQGFKQLAMDFGMSIDSIAEKTGFSPSTVRRRLKLGELNQETLKKVSGRQISMNDLDKLAELKDPEVRDKVLESVGTNNFESRYLTAKQTQDRAENEKGWRELLTNRGYVEMKPSEHYATKYESAFHINDPVNEEALDENVKDGEAYYWYYDYGCVWFKTLKEDAEEDTVAKTKVKLEIDRREEAKNSVLDAFKRAHQLRFDFIKNYKETEAKKHLTEILYMGVECNKKSYHQPYTKYFAMLAGFTESELMARNDSPGWEEIVARTTNGHFKLLLNYVYSTIGDHDGLHCTHLYPWQGHVGEFVAGSNNNGQEKLTTIYNSLLLLGYEMSDEERELMNGTSLLYYHEPTDAADDAPEEKTEQKTRFEAYKAMTDEELNEELLGQDNAFSDFANSLREAETAEELAGNVQSWFCKNADGCNDEDDDAPGCFNCILAWLNEPYSKDE